MSYKLSLPLLFLLFLSLACSIAADRNPEPANTPTPTSEPSPLTFTGTWDGAEYGILTMTQEGNNVFGAYEYLDNVGGTRYGYIKGVVEDEILIYDWWQSLTPGTSYEEAEERGEGYFILGQDGNSLHGEWRGEDSTDWVDDWNLIRIKQENEFASFLEIR